MPSSGTVEIEQDGRIAKIIFSHPKANSLPADLLDQLADSIRQASALPKVSALQLQSKGKTFCAGASFDEFEKLSTLEEAESFFSRFATLFLVMKECPKWIVGRIQGKSVGGGVGLVAACDYAIGGPSMAAKLSEYALDIGPYVIGPVIERRIGPAAFATMALDCKWRDASWCLERGLIDVLAQTEADLEQSCTEIVESLSSRSMSATATLKKVAWEQSSHFKQLLYARARTSAESLMAKKSKEK